MIRVLAMAAGLFGAVGLSQFPEFSQQYMQRLSGAVDELQRVVVQFDADAAQVGLSRMEALEELAQGGKMGTARAQSMRGVIERHARLNEDLTSLKTSTAFGKILKYRNFNDQEIARKTLSDFQPGLPVTPEAFGFGVLGFGLGYSFLFGIGLVITGRLRFGLRGHTPQT